MKGYPKVLHPNIHKKIFNFPEDYVTVKQAEMISKCTHPTKYCVSEFSESEQFSYCTKCLKDLTKN